VGKRSVFYVLAVFFFLPTLVPSAFSWARSLAPEYLLLLLDESVADIWLEPGKIPIGGESALHWSVAEGVSATIDQGVGTVSGQGQTAVSPLDSTTYTLTATREEETYTDSATLLVANPFIGVQPPTIFRGQSSTLSWDATNADSAAIEPGIGAVALTGSSQVAPEATTTYAITAQVAGQPATDETTLVVEEPMADISVSPETVDYGECAFLSWTVTGTDAAAITPGIGAVEPSGSQEVCPSQTTTYQLSAQTSAGAKGDEATLTVTCNNPTASLWSNAEVIWPGQSVTLGWYTLKADTFGFSPDLGTVTPSGSLSVTPSGSTTYVLTVARLCGSQATDSVEVRWPSIKAEPADIARGQKTTLTWEAGNGVSVSIEPGLGSVAASGSVEVQPLEDTTYSMTVSGANGTYQTSCTVGVAQPEPSVSLAASPRVVIEGQSTTLTWTSERIEEGMAISPGVGSVADAGSLSVTPAATTTYELTGSGHGTTAVSRVTVIVRPASTGQSSSNFTEHYADLVPEGLSLTDYDSQRFAVATGQVVGQQGAPLAGVSVSILDHPEWGSAVTDSNGVYSIPVEGGETLTVVLSLAGHLEAQRQVSPAWHDVAVAATISMVPATSGAAGLAMSPKVRTLVASSGKAKKASVHRGTMVSDESGSRRCTVVFPPTLRAFSADARGRALDELPAMEVSSTEYATPDSMPAALPPTSAFTYCVELTAEGQENVTFSEPAIIWVNNFLKFPVGSVVPMGSYDQARGVWIPEENALVVRLLDQDGNEIVDAVDSDGVASSLDSDGDGQPNDLDADGLYDDEVLGLDDPAQYQPGEEYWRAGATHFTAYDLNAPFGPPPGGTGPDNPPPDEDSDEDDDPCKNSTGSEVNHRSRAFHDDIPIPGTNLTLHYASDRTPGYKRIITVPASGATVPELVKRIIVKAEVAGRVFEQTLDPQPNQTVRFTWDGLDWLGRPSPSTTAKVSVGFVYDGYYYSSREETIQAFGQWGEAPTIVFARQEVILWQRHDLPLTSWSGGTALAQGWTLSANHFLDSQGTPVLHLGDGGSQQQEALIARIKSKGDFYFNPIGICRDNLGNIFTVSPSRGTLHKIAPSGTITAIIPFGGLDYPWDVAVDKLGNLYVTEKNKHCVTMIAHDGTKSTYGSIDITSSPLGLVFDAWGNLYVADEGKDCIWKIDPLQRTTIIAGHNPTAPSVDGNPSSTLKINDPCGICVDMHGNIYVTQQRFPPKIYKLKTDGSYSTVAGGGEESNFEGLPATQASLSLPVDIAVDDEGNVYFSSYYAQKINVVDTQGIIHTLAGSGEFGDNGDGLPAQGIAFRYPAGILTNPDGTVDAADSNNNRVITIGPSLSFPGLTSAGEVAVADGGELHVFTLEGRHLRTLDATTGKPLRFFDYDAEGRLTTITDRFGRAVTIDWQNPAAPRIVSPDGPATVLAIDTNDRLTSITWPGGQATGFEYDGNGLLTAKIDPRGKRFGHVFDAEGRIVQATNEAGGNWRYASGLDETGKTRTTVTTGENEVTTYLDGSTATTESSVITSPSGALTTWTKNRDSGKVHKELSCGTVLDFEYATDPVLREQYVSKQTKTVSQGLSLVTTYARAATDTNADGRPDRFTRTTTEGGQAYVRVEDVLAGTITATSPAGRVSQTHYDPETLLVADAAAPGLEPVRLAYDAAGRLIREETGAGADLRDILYGYDAQGNLHTVTDPLARSTTLDHDANGRVTTITRPGGSTIGFAYDASGNTTLLTTPRPVDHGFGYNAANNRTGWTPPEGNPTAYTFDKDNRLTRITRPSGRQVEYVYSQDQLVSILTPEGGVSLDWLCDTKLGSVSAGGESLTYAYNGPLLTSEAASGTLAATVDLGYDANLRVSSLGYAGGSETIAYDADNLVTQVGRNVVGRNAISGLPESVSDQAAGGAYAQSRTFNGFGELTGWTDTLGGSARAAVTLQRNKAGQITDKTVTVEGTPVHYVYAYDDLGRLTGVTKNGVSVESYGYGAGGWRTSDHLGRTYDYSPGDRLLTAGNVTYTYDPDGFLATRTEAGHTTTYTYTARGELTRVALPDGRIIKYVYDPQGRRIAKKVGGEVVEKYQWLGQTTLLAVYDGSDALKWRFEYADGRMPVSAVNSAGTRHYLLFDQVGTPLAVTDAAGAIIKRLDHDTFGRRLLDTNPTLAIPFGFAGGLCDTDTGLVRFGARDYDPETGRWTALDPIGFSGKDTDLFGYCVNDPVNRIDPSGNCAMALPIIWPVIWPAIEPIIGGIIGAIIGSIIGNEVTRGNIDAWDLPDTPECHQEWKEAKEICKKELDKPCRNRNRRITGGHENIDDCARGLVSEECGGNPVRE